MKPRVGKVAQPSKQVPLATTCYVLWSWDEVQKGWMYEGSFRKLKSLKPVRKRISAYPTCVTKVKLPGEARPE